MSTDPKLFNENAYQAAPKNNFTIGSTDALANKGMVLSFWHVPSQTSVYFKAFIVAFNEDYNSEWGGESVYGRADPIYLFKQTQRKITLNFKVPCSTEGEAYENLSKVQKLVQFLYPSYTETNSATTIAESPLVRLKIMNLLTKATQGASGANAEALYESYQSSNDGEQGLLGVITNLTVNHNIENPDIGVLEKKASAALQKQEGTDHAYLGAILPKMIEISVGFSPIHETPLGWDKDTFSNQYFPYGAPNADVEAASDRSKMHTKNFWNVKGQPTRGVYGSGLAIPAGGFGFTESEAEKFPPAPEGTTDQEEEEGYTPEQDAANAEARYAGIMGNVRFNRDLRRAAKGKTSDYQESALGGALQSAEDYRITGRTERAVSKSDDPFDFMGEDGLG
tara:strand:+ start:3178 stop:4362 length:1185 start_codon:yes stop_codon:yes gene_type:complete